MEPYFFGIFTVSIFLVFFTFMSFSSSQSWFSQRNVLCFCLLFLNFLLIHQFLSSIFHDFLKSSLILFNQTLSQFSLKFFTISPDFSLKFLKFLSDSSKYQKKISVFSQYFSHKNSPTRLQFRTRLFIVSYYDLIMRK